MAAISKGIFFFFFGTASPIMTPMAAQTELNEGKILPVRLFNILISAAEQTFHKETSFTLCGIMR